MFWRVQDAMEAEEMSPKVLDDIRISDRVITQRQWIFLPSRPGVAELNSEMHCSPILRCE